MTFRTIKTADKAQPAAKLANPSPTSRPHPAHSMLEAQSTIGNQAVLKWLESPNQLVGPPQTIAPRILRKTNSQPPISGSKHSELTVSQPGDVHEREAERIAAHVISTPSLAAEKAENQSRSRSDLIADMRIEGPTWHVQRLELQQTGIAPAGFSAPDSVHETISSNGRPLDAETRSFMEARFGYDFGGVLIHTDSKAAASAKAVGAHAYTVGHNIAFAESKYTPDTDEGKHLLAHELAHVVQQQNGSNARLLRFASAEHVEIGNRALPNQTVLISSYGTISFGEMIALAGDYFESLTEMQSLAQSHGDFGKQQIDFALWKVNPSRPPPIVGEGVEEAVMGRYYALAARNETHFSTGSTPGRSNLEQYIAEHTKAIEAAYREGLSPLTPGLGWEAQEAVACHFLTDAFSAGHVRTPRGQIQQHWGSLYPTFQDNLVRTISCYMASYIDEHDPIGWGVTISGLASEIEPIIRSKGGPALKAFSIGDMISVVMHDADSEGLDVTSLDSPRGSRSAPARWRSVGDGSLYPNQSSTDAMQTQQYVEEAVRLSYEEAQRTHSAGASGDRQNVSMIKPESFRALRLIPTADRSSTRNPTYNWRVNSIQDLPGDLSKLISKQFMPGTEVRSKLDAIPVDPITYKFHFALHTGDAWAYFRQELLENPIVMIQKIGAGDVCPAENNRSRPAKQHGGKSKGGAHARKPASRASSSSK